MTPIQATELTERIARMYPFLENDETYMDIWINVARDADYELTLQRFYEYIADPAHARKPPMPADILTKPKPKDGFQQEQEKMQQWEADAKAHPPDWNQVRELFAQIGVSDDE
ncbi:hypothetical protein [Sporolactobacillus terrae]|uniref:Replicative helicase inhibitor G39P N-terminal domain-containing protein n=1 Tax=Sporolactobacillus terrae TaxID=269673 RepID=A0A5K7X5S0_9BACL|nr:hypothetical protein [Sporolactobacillus terrae]BBN99186.1 hypothetical protein St703_18910 [Sporolactobacillus terrae]